ncbi:hypothetical protein TNCV_363911 [Trichonephila clavipes]|uniref:Uncharacterized protein n=1 Tax=Trichonephila clavipes TaxID=2585209 RepID=A0A8X6VHQ0_TRICX|nr:hypothetical protein TNCV_363911 [Trichonephila clavipes]
MSKCTSFRLTVSNNNNTVKAQINKDIDNFITKSAIKYGLPIEAFDEYKYNILKDLMKFSYHSQYEFTFKDIKQKICELQKNFIIVYIDKVPGNYAVICGSCVAAVAEWYGYRTVAFFVTGSSPVPLKTRRVGQRCTLNLSRAETNLPLVWCGS